MLAQDRQDHILEMIEKEGSVKVSKLIQMFDVSIETVRRDLEGLEKMGYLKRVYGGAVLRKNTQDRLNYEKREVECMDEKIEIAKTAIKQIEEGQSIALNGGTTCVEIAKELKKNFKRLTIITNSLRIAYELADTSGFTVILAGGILNGKEYSFSGEYAEDLLSNFTVDKAFISVGGVSLTRGITDYLIEEAGIQKKFMEISTEVVILADSNKIDNISLVKIADVQDVNLIITDSRLDSKIIGKYIKSGIEIINQ